MSEDEAPANNTRGSMLRAVATRVRALSSLLAPSISWLYLAFAVYFLVGATLYPGWWKRFVYDAGFADSRFWIAAYQYLESMIKGRLPLGLVLAAFLVFVPMYLVFNAGRVGPRRMLSAIKMVPRSLLISASVVVVLTCVGLAAVKADYLTPDEIHAELEAATERLKNPNSFRSLLRPAPPKSGFFIYLDAPKLGRAYNTLQKELTVVLQTDTQEDSSERKLAASLKTVNGEAISRERVETSVQRAPPSATPERQAQWLIQTYNELDLVVDLPLFFGGTDFRSYDLKEALETLKDRGVVLTRHEVDIALAGDAALLEKKVNKPNVPLLFEGDIRLEGGQEHFTVDFETGGGAHILAKGTGAMAALDDGLHACSRQPDGCKFKGKILAIVWRASPHGTSIDLDIIPLAMW